ncbi:class I SAM-dependent methyltransferase [Devosia chinhatensis]|uniref:class I SAM-dependent methyltransferase n=1 Tax=Devosia chinhatensis TaxID=429727 RepID=UPI001FCD1950|nr:50S ribosomal protein L11 methyltransferase [Devosia chinhatensis]
MPVARVSAAEDFIRARLVLTALPFRPDIVLYQPHPHSGLIAFLAEAGRDEPPYWAYAWAGGAALALYLRDNPQAVSGRTVLDFGAGSGLVGIAAARAGAAAVMAFEPDAIGQIALGLNAKANGVALIAAEAMAEAEIVLAGDVFYDAAVAARTLPVLKAHARRGAKVLVGDPFRRHLPRAEMTRIATYDVPDMGGGPEVTAGIFVLQP